MQDVFDQISELIRGYMPNLLGALAILVVGWLIALVIAAAVRMLLKKTTLDQRLASVVVGEEKAPALPVERWVSRGVFYLIMLFVVVAFFQVLGLTQITEPLNELLTRLFEFAPRLIAALVLFLIAWVVASVLRMLVTKALGASKIDEKLAQEVSEAKEKKVSLVKPLGEAVYWVTLALFLPAILDALALEGPLEPVTAMFNRIMEFVPNLFAASLILLGGWLIARIVQRIASNVLAAAGLDALSERVGLAAVLGKQKLSNLVGLVIYVLILIPALIASLNALAMDAITRPASEMLEKILAALPNIFGAFLVIAIAYVVGRVISTLVANLLRGAGFNAILSRLGVGREVTEGKATPSEVVGYIALVTILLFASIEAARLLGFDLMADLVSKFMVFAGHLVVGIIIFGIGLFVANLAAQTIQTSGHGQAAWLALAARVAIILLAAAMALRHMELANEIINIAFGLLLGAVAVAVALAFGLGGREIAARSLQEWRDSMKAK